MPWHERPVFSPPHRDGMTLRLVGLAGGVALATRTSMDDPPECALFDPVSDRWSTIEPAGPATPLLYEHGLLALPDGRALAVGGGFLNPTANCSTFDPGTRTWRVGPALPHALSSPAVAVVGERVLAVRRGAVVAWTPGDAEWEVLPGLGNEFLRTEGSFYPPVLVGAPDGSALWVVVDSFSEAARMNPETEAWEDFERPPLLAAGVARVAGEVVLAGGDEYEGQGLCSRRVERWRTGWQRGRELPEKRRNARVIWLGDRTMAVVGGARRAPERGTRMDAYDTEPAESMFVGDGESEWRVEPSPPFGAFFDCCPVGGGGLLALQRSGCHLWRP